MKKGLIVFILSAIFLIALVAAQVSTSTSQGAVVSSSLAGLWSLIVGIVVWIAKEIFFGAAYVLGLPTSQTNGIIFALVIWILLWIAMAKILSDFTLFSKPIAWIISLALTFLLAIVGILKIFGLALLGFISTFTTSTGKILALGILSVLLIYIIIRLILGKFGYSFRKQKQEVRKAKEEAGRKSLEKLGETFKK